MVHIPDDGLSRQTWEGEEECHYSCIQGYFNRCWLLLLLKAQQFAAQTVVVGTASAAISCLCLPPSPPPCNSFFIPFLLFWFGSYCFGQRLPFLYIFALEFLFSMKSTLLHFVSLFLQKRAAAYCTINRFNLRTQRIDSFELEVVCVCLYLHLHSNTFCKLKWTRNRFIWYIVTWSWSLLKSLKVQHA